MQIAHNMALDSELSGNQHKVASALLFALIDGETGWCYQKDEQLAEIANVSLGTLRKAIRSSPAFQKYFEVVPGTRTGRATEYRLTQEAMQDAARRRSGDLRLLERASGERAVSASETCSQQRLPLVAKIATSGENGGKSSPEPVQKIPSVGGKNCLPIPEEKSMENPNCAAGTAPQSTNFEKFREEFSKLYPRPGSPEETDRELRKALESGATPDAILWGARCYAIEQKGNQPRYIAYSENWVRDKRWESHVKPAQSPSDTTAKDVRRGYLRAIQNGNSNLAKHCPVPWAIEMISAGDVTTAQCRTMGISI